MNNATGFSNSISYLGLYSNKKALILCLPENAVGALRRQNMWKVASRIQLIF